MSRRPRAVPEQVLARRLAAMAPGGLLRSESPVRRAEGALRPPRAGGMGGVSPSLLFWWPFDEASGTFADSLGNAAYPFDFISGVTHHEAALTGGGYAMGLGDAITTGGSWFHPAGTLDYGAGSGFGPDATGCIGVDFWVSGLRVPGSGTQPWFFQMYQGGYTNTYQIQTTSGGDVEFRFWGPGGGVLHTTTPGTLSDAAHIRWDINPATETSRAYWNGSLISEEVATYSVAWSPTAEWHIGVNNPNLTAGSKVVFDELKIYGV